MPQSAHNGPRSQDNYLRASLCHCGVFICSEGFYGGRALRCHHIPPRYSVWHEHIRYTAAHVARHKYGTEIPEFSEW